MTSSHWALGGGSQQVFESGCGNVSEVRQTPIQSPKKLLNCLLAAVWGVNQLKIWIRKNRIGY